MLIRFNAIAVLSLLVLVNGNQASAATGVCEAAHNNPNPTGQPGGNAGSFQSASYTNGVVVCTYATNPGVFTIAKNDTAGKICSLNATTNGSPDYSCHSPYRVTISCPTTITISSISGGKPSSGWSVHDGNTVTVNASSSIENQNLNSGGIVCNYGFFKSSLRCDTVQSTDHAWNVSASGSGGTCSELQ